MFNGTTTWDCLFRWNLILFAFFCVQCKPFQLWLSLLITCIFYQLGSALELWFRWQCLRFASRKQILDHIGECYYSTVHQSVIMHQRHDFNLFRTLWNFSKTQVLTFMFESRAAVRDGHVLKLSISMQNKIILGSMMFVQLVIIQLKYRIIKQWNRLHFRRQPHTVNFHEQQ